MVFVNCAAGAIKYILFFFNLLCAIAGIVLVVHGSISLVKTAELRNILSNDHLSDTVPTIVIGFGVFIFLISFIGCCGAVRQNVCLIETYSIFMMVLVLLQVMLACFIFLFIDDIQKDTGRSFNKLWRTRGTSLNSMMMVDMIQENLECCGSNNLFDYSEFSIPPSCCKKTVERCTRELSYGVGCKNHLSESIKSSASLISYMCLGTAIFELVAAIMGFILSGYLRKVHEIRRCCY